MSSIRSVLIKTSMSNIQKEISQLEHWLNNLPPSIDTPSIHTPSIDTPNIHTPSIHTPGIDTNLHQIMNRLSEQTYNQELILKNIIERLDIIEGFRTSNREIFIDNQDTPWLDNNCEPLNEENNSEMYNVYKEDTKDSISEVESEIEYCEPVIPCNIKTEQKVEEEVVEVEQKVEQKVEVVKEVKVEQVEVIKEQVKVEQVEQVKVEEVEVIKEVKEEVEVKDEVEEVEEVEVVKEEEEEEVEVVKKEEVEEDEEEEEEVEEGIELEEITYKNITYYKDNENFIYSIIDDEPSEIPVGYWKEKTQTIAFYKNK